MRFDLNRDEVIYVPLGSRRGPYSYYPSPDILEWLHDNGIQWHFGHETVFRSKFVFHIEVPDEQASLLFKLRWG